MSAKPSSVRIRLVQFEVTPGRPWENARRMLNAVEPARRDGVRLLVFPEMAIPGYLLGDEWERESFLRDCEAAGESIRQASSGMTVVFGNVGIDWTRRNEDGRVRKYNACFVAHDGKFAAPENGAGTFVVKTLMPNYREFDDSRHFYDTRKLALDLNMPVEKLITPLVAGDLRLGCVLCEDAWDSDYASSPLQMLARQRIDLLVNISASPYTFDKNHKRNRVFAEQARKVACPMIYCNHTGIQDNGKTVFSFDGSSCIYDSHGAQIAAGAPFEEAELTADIPLAPGAAFGNTGAATPDSIAVLDCAILYGTRKFMERCGVRRVVIGASGGIDSAVVSAIYSRILSPEDLLLINMPSRFNSSTTRNAARDLAAAIDCLYAEVPIQESVDFTRKQLDGLETASVSGSRRRTLALSGLVVENIQARDRGSRLLAGVAAAFGGAFTCNGNKSEITVGYATLYGDLGGYLASIGDLWKTEVYALARHMNDNVFGRQVIPKGSLDVTPSAELSADQNVDEGKGDPIIYPYHDTVFRSWVEWWNRATPEELLAWYSEGILEKKLGYGGRISDLFATPAAFIADIERWWNLYQGMAIAKRIQAPPVLAVKRRAFGFDHREAQIGPRYTRRYQELKTRLLART